MSAHHRLGGRLRAFILIASPAAILCAFAAAGGSTAASAQVRVFPIPGSRTVTPQTQIAFRGTPASEFGTIMVRGSQSGLHTGRVESDSDGQGGSFLPAKPFTPGEVVTVSTGLNVLGARNGSFQFTVETPAGGVPFAPLPAAPRVRGDLLRFRSRPGLAPTAVTITKRSARTAPGDIFLAPQQGPLQYGPMILDPSGGLVWFKPLPRRTIATDFRVQTYQGQPVLTWWQGYLGAGVGAGDDVINNTAYQRTAVVHAANGLNADLHEFEITPQGTALITAYNPVYWNASSVHASKREIVYDAVVQEIDIPTGLVLFQWNSLDHVPLSDGYTTPPLSRGSPYDYFHINSIDQDHDGNLLVSGRNTWAAYKIDIRTGRTIWTLGGRHSSFRMGPGAQFAFQHDVRVRASKDRFVTLFDDGAGPPTIHNHSRGLKLILDFRHMTARWAGGLDHSPQLLADFEGNYQQLPGGDNFLGWGQQPYFTEFNSRGQVVFDGHFVGANSSYRAYRFPWAGTPDTLPAVAATDGRHPTVYASWNGATNVASWRVLGGPSASSLSLLGTVAKRGFETSIPIRSNQYVQVQALDSSGHLLGSSVTVRAQ